MKPLSGNLRVIFIIIGFTILGYSYPTVNIANAQCAWMLWEGRSDEKDYLRWQLNDAFPSYEKCKQSQLMECERWKQMLLEETSIERVVDNCPRSLTIFYKISSRSPQEIHYRCFPDTIDPRK